MAATTYGQSAHGSSRFEDRSDLSREDLRGIAKKHGPDPSSRYYKLDEQLLRDGALKPLEKLILIDLHHRNLKVERIDGIGARAKEFNVSHDALTRAETELVNKGYLLRRLQVGKPALYLIAYPPKPDGTEGRDDYVNDFYRTFGCQPDPTPLQRNPTQKADTPQNAETPQKADTTLRKMRIHPTQNADTLQPHTNYCLEEKKGEERAPELRTRKVGIYDAWHEAERLYNAEGFAVEIKRFHGVKPDGKDLEAYLGLIADWLQEGTWPTRKQVAAAVDQALEWWHSTKKPGYCPGVGPLKKALVSVVTPPSPPPTATRTTDEYARLPEPTEEERDRIALASLAELKSLGYLKEPVA